MTITTEQLQEQIVELRGDIADLRDEQLAAKYADDHNARTMDALDQRITNFELLVTGHTYGIDNAELDRKALERRIEALEKKA